MNLFMKQKWIHVHGEQTNRPVVAKGGGLAWEVGISGCKLLYME